MAGLCGCWRVGSGSNGGCDGCGYKVLLRGTLAPTSARPPLPSRHPNNNQPVEKNSMSHHMKHKKEKNAVISDGVEHPLSLSSHHRRHSHPVRSPPEPPPDPHLPRSLQRRRLPQSSAYNVPLPPASPPTLVSLVPQRGGGIKEAKGPLAYSLPHQPLLLSTIQPPPELCPPAPLPPPLTRTPPFDLSSFLPPSPSPQLSSPTSPRPGLTGLLSGVSASTSLQVRYRALSLARAASTTRSHTDLRSTSTKQQHDTSKQRNSEHGNMSAFCNSDFVETSNLRFKESSSFHSESEVRSNSGSNTLLPTPQQYQLQINPNLYTSRTLPAPAPSQQPRRYVVKPPQHLEQNQLEHKKYHSQQQQQQQNHREMQEREQQKQLLKRQQQQLHQHHEWQQHQYQQQNQQQQHQQQLCHDQYEQQKQQQKFLYQQLQQHQQFQMELHKEQQQHQQHQQHQQEHHQQQHQQQQQQDQPRHSKSRRRPRHSSRRHRSGPDEPYTGGESSSHAGQTPQGARSSSLKSRERQEICSGNVSTPRNQLTNEDSQQQQQQVMYLARYHDQVQDNTNTGNHGRSWSDTRNGATLQHHLDAEVRDWPCI